MGIFELDEEQVDDEAGCPVCSIEEIEVIARVWQREISEEEWEVSGAQWYFDEGDVILLFPTIDSWGVLGEQIPDRNEVGDSVGGSMGGCVGGVLFDLPVRDWSFIEAHSTEADSIPDAELGVFFSVLGLVLLQRVYGRPTEADAELRQEFRETRLALEADPPAWMSQTITQARPVLN